MCPEDPEDQLAREFVAGVRSVIERAGPPPQADLTDLWQRGRRQHRARLGATAMASLAMAAAAAFVLAPILAGTPVSVPSAVQSDSSDPASSVAAVAPPVPLERGQRVVLLERVGPLETSDGATLLVGSWTLRPVPEGASDAYADLPRRSDEVAITVSRQGWFSAAPPCGGATKMIHVVEPQDGPDSLPMADLGAEAGHHAVACVGSDLKGQQGEVAEMVEDAILLRALDANTLALVLQPRPQTAS